MTDIDRIDMLRNIFLDLQMKGTATIEKEDMCFALSQYLPAGHTMCESFFYDLLKQVGLIDYVKFYIDDNAITISNTGDIDVASVIASIMLALLDIARDRAERQEDVMRHNAAMAAA